MSTRSTLVSAAGRAFYRAEPSGGAVFNRNAHLPKVVRAVLVAGLYPQLVRAQSEPGKPTKFETRRFGEARSRRQRLPVAACDIQRAACQRTTRRLGEACFAAPSVSSRSRAMPARTHAQLAHY